MYKTKKQKVKCSKSKSRKNKRNRKSKRHSVKGGGMLGRLDEKDPNDIPKIDTFYPESSVKQTIGPLGMLGRKDSNDFPKIDTFYPREKEVENSRLSVGTTIGSLDSEGIIENSKSSLNNFAFGKRDDYTEAMNRHYKVQNEKEYDKNEGLIARLNEKNPAVNGKMEKYKNEIVKIRGMLPSSDETLVYLWETFGKEMEAVWQEEKRDKAIVEKTLEAIKKDNPELYNEIKEQFIYMNDKDYKSVKKLLEKIIEEIWLEIQNKRPVVIPYNV